VSVGRAPAFVTALVLGAGVVLAVSVVAGAASPTVPGPPAGPLEAQRPTAVSVKAATLGMRSCSKMLELGGSLVVGACRERAAARGQTGPLHLVVAQRLPGGAAAVKYTGPSAGDAYSLKPTVFARPGAAGPFVVLAEAAAELSYGIGVYVVDGASVRHAGDMDVGVATDDGEGPSSAVPFARLEWTDAGLCVRFTRDLVRPKPDGTYTPVARDRLAYVYASGRLTEATSCGNR